METTIKIVTAGLIWFIVSMLVYKMGRLRGEEVGWHNGSRQAWLRAARSLRSFTSVCTGSLNPFMIKMLGEHADFCKDMANHYTSMKAIVYKCDIKEEKVIDLDSKSDLVFKDK